MRSLCKLLYTHASAYVTINYVVLKSEKNSLSLGGGIAFEFIPQKMTAISFREFKYEALVNPKDKVFINPRFELQFNRKLTDHLGLIIKLTQTFSKDNLFETSSYRLRNLSGDFHMHNGGFGVEFGFVYQI